MLIKNVCVKSLNDFEDEELEDVVTVLLDLLIEEDYRNITRESITDILDDDYDELLVYMEGEEVIGYIIVSYEFDNRTHINQVLISKKHRGKGIFSKIIKYLLDNDKCDYDDTYRITLEVNANNKGAICAYLNNDFVITGFANYYYDSKDCLHHKYGGNVLFMKYEKNM